MEEAVEICKLRLFLKLAAQVEPDTSKQNLGIEPLPDIDFNIRCGNTLVGYATAAEVRRCMAEFGGGQMRLGVEDELNSYTRFCEKVELADAAFKLFREMQTRHGLGAAELSEAKRTLGERLETLEDELSRYLAKDYGVDVRGNTAYKTWLTSHQPFHWFVEYYGIISKGGFDVIIGNPPYAELSTVCAQYRPRNFATESCGNLYALCTERSFALQHGGSRFGFIVQQPVTSTLRMAPCRETIVKNASIIWSSTYDDRPSKLFDGMHHARLAIILSKRGAETELPIFLTTSYNKWFKEQREHVFRRLNFLKVRATLLSGIFPKITSNTEVCIIEKLFRCPDRFEAWLSGSKLEYKLFYKITGVGSWFTITPRPPKFLRGGKESSSTRENHMTFSSGGSRDRAFCVLNSTLFYWF